MPMAVVSSTGSPELPCAAHQPSSRQRNFMVLYTLWIQVCCNAFEMKLSCHKNAFALTTAETVLKFWRQG